MPEEYLREEEIEIDGKKIKIKTLYSPLSGSAKTPNKILVSENLKDYLGDEGYQIALLHERGHLTKLNLLISNASYILIIIIIFFLFLSFKDKFLQIFLTKISLILSLVIFIIIVLGIKILNLLEFPFFWAREIFADNYAIKVVGYEKYRDTFLKIYAHPGYSGNKNWDYRNILHPPEKIRFWFMEKFKN